MGWAVWMHVLERGRASNTGKLLEHLLPNCEIFLHGLPEDRARFAERVTAAAGQTFVLFPSETALPVHEALGPTVADSSVGTAGGTEPLVVILDGTWSQAKHMQRQCCDFDGLTRIALGPVGPSEFHWRRQSQEGRISTVEAAGFFLDEFAAAWGQEVGATSSCLREALQVLMTALEKQSRCDAVLAPLPDGKGECSVAAGNARMPKRQLGVQKRHLGARGATQCTSGLS